ncbi:MAG: alpha-L-glutamate ligase-like protein [Acidobacteriota bacterium]
MIESFRALRRLGVLGINRRNIEFIREYNPRKLYPLVDDKLLTKKLALEAGLPVPDLFGVMSTQHDIRDLSRVLEDRSEFVCKPAHGSGGNGVMVIKGRRGDIFYKSSGSPIDKEEISHHLSNMISGLYSLAGQRDHVMIEYCVRTAKPLLTMSYQGVPDIRLIVLLGYPVMAMVRLPTRLSDGRANLHQGAVGVGVDIATGTTLGGVLENRVVGEHPDTGQGLAGITLPEWDRMLKMAAMGYEITGLGYLGIDIVIDQKLGPLILELNARPGLSVQIANKTGLEPRLRRIESIAGESRSLESRVAYCKEHFGVPLTN